MSVRTKPFMAGLAFVFSMEPACSWIFVHKAPEEPISPTPPLVCTSSAATPILDTVGAVLLGAAGAVTTIGTAAWPSSGFLSMSSSDKAVGIGVGVAMMGGATALGFSAGYGYDKTSACRNLKNAQLSCVSGVEAACVALKNRTEWRTGKDAGEPCQDDAECQPGNSCFRGRCQPKQP
jgi:hypothetical protein